MHRILSKPAILKWLAFITCLSFFGLTSFSDALEKADRYTALEKADWIPTNVWLRSAECARLSGAWLAICDGDNLVPLSEYSFGDDPGHALLLGFWAMASDDIVGFDDVARLNIALNTAGLIILASFLFAIRAYVTSAVFVAAGPIVYLGWIGISPHWGLIGVVSMAMVLPMVLIARDYGFLARRSSNAYLVVGFLGLLVAVMVREVIGLMVVGATIGVIGVLIVRRRRSLRSTRPLLGLCVLGLLVLAVSGMSTWAVVVRDALFDMEPAQRVATHNFSHTLYIGLGAVPNTFGISYDDDFAKESVERIAPEVVYCSPEYYRVLWKLYWSKLRQAPDEVMRIYIEKTRLLLADRILDSAPPLGFVLILAVAHFMAATLLGLWSRFEFSQGLLVEGAAFVLIGLFVAQAILALPSRMYAMPAGVALLLLFGVMLEFGIRWAMHLLRHPEPAPLVRSDLARAASISFNSPHHDVPVDPPRQDSRTKRT